MSNRERIRELVEAVRSFDLILEGERTKLLLDVITPEASITYLLSKWMAIREILNRLIKAGE